jgi:predicted aspartyl protease
MTSNGVRQLQTYNCPQMYVEQFKLPTASEVLLYDLDGINSADREHIAGLIGMSNLRNMCIRIDMESCQIEVLNRVPNDLRGLSLSYSKSGTPHVLCEISNRPAESFLVDTGVTEAIVVNEKLFDSLRGERRISRIRQVVGHDNNGKVLLLSSGRVDRVAIGSFEFTNETVVEGVENVIGIGFLRRFVSTIDFKNGMLYLSPKNRVLSPDTTGLHGFGVCFEGDKLVVATIDYNSPADRVDLQVNDVVEQINGDGIDGKTLFQINKLIDKPKQSLKLSVRRGDEKRYITVAVP